MSAFFVGDARHRTRAGTAIGALAEERGRAGYRIDGVDALAPFLVAVVGADDTWLYATSGGVLSAGRGSPEGALFPYETDDRMFERDGRSGGRTVVFARHGSGPERRWEPFLRAADGQYAVSRSLWKSLLSDELVLRERNDELGLELRVAYTCDGEFGLQRRVELLNIGAAAVSVRLMDGLVDLQAADVARSLQDGLSCLVDAYRISEQLPEAGLALFRLGSIPADRPVPNEALLANCAWVRGLGEVPLHLGLEALESFRRGEALGTGARFVRGRKGALLARADLSLAPAERAAWVLGADAGLDARAIERLVQRLGHRGAPPLAALDAARDGGWSRLAAVVAAGDGVASTDEPLHDARHASNVLFNLLRGGTLRWWHGHGGFGDHLARHYPTLHARGAPPLDLADDRRAALVAWAAATGDPDRERIAREWLPLTLARRHGDPSRPWNRFSIRTRNEAGRRTTGYEGNWRDLFQNWEALLHAYPAWAEAAVHKFLNATTADGFNPYRVTSEGFEWEVPDPADPWAHIGYWGDHQIVYLERLLDLAERVEPGGLRSLLDRRLFVYADVPYRLAGFDALVVDPRTTIRFDEEAHAESARRVATEGNEGRLLRVRDGGLARASLAEKLLIPILSKLSHFVPGAGIWLDTQRPEWNDANNALVGSGASVVTVCQLVRHLATVTRLVAAGPETLGIDQHVAAHAAEVEAALVGDPVATAVAPEGRRAVLEALGRAGQRYRAAVYNGLVGGGERVRLERAVLMHLLDRAEGWLRATLWANRRPDGLWHSYNLLRFEGAERLVIDRLPLMLEGQVAAVASGALAPDVVREVLDTLRRSALWRADLGTYLLYPDREVTPFLARGAVPDEALAAIPGLDTLLGEDAFAAVLRRGADTLRFAPALTDSGALAARVDALVHDARRPAAWRDQLGAARGALLDAYERTFHHAAFTGRSGSFFAYEGLGCVYWHMVSKLRLAVMEVLDAASAGPTANDSDVAALAGHYAEIRAGLGIECDPATYGAVPTDPYSHTPSSGGARQPGMTGQVKEDLLARRLELGVRFEEGRICFRRTALGPRDGARLAVCGTQVTVAVAADDGARVEVELADGAIERGDGLTLSLDRSRDVFQRNGAVRALRVVFRI
jgi:hypothetical protein